MGAVLAGHGGGGGAGLESVVAATCKLYGAFWDRVVPRCVALQTGLSFLFVPFRPLLSGRCCGPQLLLFFFLLLLLTYLGT